jgi:hypothetical protein
MLWIHLDPDRDQWQALVNAVTNIQIQQNAGNFSCCCEQLLAYEAGFGPMDFVSQLISFASLLKV